MGDACRGWRGGGNEGTSPAAASGDKVNLNGRREQAVIGGKRGARRQSSSRPRQRLGTIQSPSLLAGNVERVQFLRKKTGIDLGVTVYTLYAMAIRSVIATVGQPLRDARARQRDLFQAASKETAAAAAAAAATAGAVESAIEDAGGGVGSFDGPAAEALAREAVEMLPFPYLPSVGALLLVVTAVAAHALLYLGKKWSVPFHAWSSFDEVLTWEEADAVLVTPVRHTGEPAICPLVGKPPFEGDPVTGVSKREDDDDVDEGGEDEGKDLSSEEELGESEGESDEGSKPTEGSAERPASATAVDEEAHVDADPPSFVYQRRKFILKRAAGGPVVVHDSGVHAAKDGDEEDKDKGDAGREDAAEEDVGVTFGLVELPVKWPLGRYLNARGLSPDDVPAKLRLFGENSVKVKQPKFRQHLMDRLTSPFVVFNLFNQVLWMLELYWTKALLAMAEIVVVEAVFVADAERRRRQLDIRNSNKQDKRLRAWRGGQWLSILVSEMLPGDVISLTSGVVAGVDSVAEGGKDEAGAEEENEELFAVGELPADVLLLRGTAVVDEASLTGESVPQIKTSLTSEPIDVEEALDMTGRHSCHVLLSGTTLLDQTNGGDGESHPSASTDSSAAATESSPLPEATPDGGALCFVLRTGSYSFQGDLRRSIDFGSHGVRQESKDAAYLLGFLLFFAALSSAHVVREGLKSPTVSGFRLLVQCIRILSTVVPSDLSFELNQCLRNGVRSLQKGYALACTEPYRIPLAGKVDVCLFDKTGTITSDKLRAENLVVSRPLHPDSPPTTIGLGRSSARGGLSADSTRPGLSAEVVIGGCHSLMDVAGVLHGDPLEVSALEGILWSWNASSHIATPRKEVVAPQNETETVDSGGGEGSEGDAVGVDGKDSGGKKRSKSSGDVKRQEVKVKASGSVSRGKAQEDASIKNGSKTASKGSKGRAGAGEEGEAGSDGVSVGVWRRYAFSSQLQRMSVIAEVFGSEALTGAKRKPEAWVLCKGSPEAMKPLVDQGSLPSWYDSEYDRLARTGRRVVALAHRSLGSSQARGAKKSFTSLSRKEVEKEGSLIFDGFLSFHCKTRADSKRVITDLRDGGDCSVTIVTGDSVLTACHVATEVGLIDNAIPAEDTTGGNTTSGGVEAVDSKGKKSGGGKSKGSTRSRKGKAERREDSGSGGTKQAKATKSRGGRGKTAKGQTARGKTALLLTVVPTENGDGLCWVPLHAPSHSIGVGKLPKEKTGIRGEAQDSSRDDAVGDGESGCENEMESSEETAARRRVATDESRGDSGGGNELRESCLKFGWDGVEGLAATHDLCATGAAFGLALALGAEDPAIGRAVQHFRVLARMTPGLKEELATLLMEAGKTVLMCGDGSNDVGALRRSHVGLALLSGFGDANTDSDSDSDVTGESKKASDSKIKASSDTAGSGGGQARAGELMGKKVGEILKVEREKVQAEINLEFERLRSEGVSPGKALWRAAASVNKKRGMMDIEGKKKAHGDFAASAKAMFKADVEEDSTDDDEVRTGDASLAAPFTSKKPSIAAVVDVVRQGRCTLAAVVHTYQMVALHALFSSYTSSVLYLMNVRWPQRPMILSQLMFAPLSLALASPGAPDEMSPIRPRPPTSVFNRSTFVSLLGQAAVHVASMAYAVRAAKIFAPPEASPAKVVHGILGPAFIPNLVSNTVFLMATIQSVSVSVVNFKGRPFMAGILETPAIFLPAVSIVAFCFAVVLEIVPPANAVSQCFCPSPLHPDAFGICNVLFFTPRSRMACLHTYLDVPCVSTRSWRHYLQLLQMAVFPSKVAKLPIVAAMLSSLMAPLAVDRFCVMLFDPDLHKARKAGPPLGREEKKNLALLGVMLLVIAVVVGTTDFDTLGDAFADLS
ncbi:unnamed protein product [Scytosiphon promiscuus]